MDTPSTPIKFVKTEFANNQEGTEASLKELALPDNLSISQVVCITSKDPLHVANVHDDLQLELAFYNQALANAVRARHALISAGIPFSRPEDYFAEMAKTDAHMARVRTRILDEKAQVTKSEVAKRHREMKKFGKQVQAQVLQDRKKEEKSVSEAVQKVVKKRKLEQISTSVEDEIDVAIMSSDEETRNHSKKQKRGVKKPAHGPARKQVNQARLDKNAKFGHGGRKKGMKRNTRESAAEEVGFMSSASSKKKGGKKVSRPGKNARAASFSKRKN